MSEPQPASERAPLLNSNGRTQRGGYSASRLLREEEHAQARTRGSIGVAVTFVFIAALVVSFTIWNESLPKDPHKAALRILEEAPVIDGHIDLPILVRALYRNNVSAFDLRKEMPGHVDIPRLQKGRVGGFFWSTYVQCKEAGPDFLKPTNRVRDTLEQIDVARLIIEQYSDVFELATDVHGIQKAISKGKIASLLGIEGAHQLGNSLGALRAYYNLGVRYITLTHVCNNAFADSGGITVPPPPTHNGLSAFGRKLISEMNRIGMLVDLSHTSDATALQALAHTAAPVIWSHSSSRAMWNISRNLPDNILKRIGREAGKKDAVVMVNFAPQFIAGDGKATVKAVADHVEHMGSVAGREHVGIGSDFDGIGSTPKGLEDVSRYPDLFAELRARGWSKTELVGLAGVNLIRVFKGVEEVSRTLKASGAPVAADVYEKRTDL